MDNNNVGCFAISIAGHDKNKLYVIVKCDDAMVWLSDGSLKKLNNPKKKKRKHIQLINKKDVQLAELIEQNKTNVDEYIRLEIKRYISNMKEDSTCQSQM